MIPLVIFQPNHVLHKRAGMVKSDFRINVGQTLWSGKDSPDTRKTKHTAKQKTHSI